MNIDTCLGASGLQSGLCLSFQGAFGGQVKHGTTLEALLRSHFAGQIINDAACAWCSLKWTVLEHRQAAAGQPAAPLVRAQGQSGACHLQSPEQDATDSTTAAALQQTAQAASAPAGMHAPGGYDYSRLSWTSRKLRQHLHLPACMTWACRMPRRFIRSLRHAAVPAGMRSRGLLERCVEGSAPLPEADVESMARQAGLRWVERRGPLLTAYSHRPGPQRYQGRSTSLHFNVGNRSTFCIADSLQFRCGCE